MFYSKQEFYDAVADQEARRIFPSVLLTRCSTNGRVERKKSDAMLAEIKKGVLDRTNHLALGVGGDGYLQYIHLGKIYRPWSIIPALRDFSPPDGDFGVGVEIEYGFTSNETAKTAMYHVRNWKHVALDREGGTHGVEATFPPILYSKLSKRDKPFRYLDYLAANRNMLSRHYGAVGTHINISASGRIDNNRRESVNDVLIYLSDTQKHKYFNRLPYGYINPRTENANGNGYVEMKLFNSTTCSITLRRYINIAVSLVQLITSATPITETSVIEALEAGYNKRNGHPRT